MSLPVDILNFKFNWLYSSGGWITHRTIIINHVTINECIEILYYTIHVIPFIINSDKSTNHDNASNDKLHSLKLHLQSLKRKVLLYNHANECFENFG